MTILLESNLDQLTRRYFNGTSAAQGASIVDRVSDRGLERLLRTHLIDAPSATEIDQRDAIDFLLGFYSILEVASVAGCIPRELPAKLVDDARRRLARPAVARYYERFYPLVLPRLFRRRLDDPLNAPRLDAYLLFVRFLHVSEHRLGKPTETFLWFLDDGTIDGWGLSDVLLTIADPEKLFKVRARREPQRTPLNDGVDGLLRFLQFARELDQLLQDCDGEPLLQSAFWHFHGYWFQQLGIQLAGVISATIERYRDYVGSGRSDEERDLIRATHSDMDIAQQSLQRLVSGIYSVALERIVLMNAPWTKVSNGVAMTELLEAEVGAD